MRREERDMVRLEREEQYKHKQTEFLSLLPQLCKLNLITTDIKHKIKRKLNTLTFCGN